MLDEHIPNLGDLTTHVQRLDFDSAARSLIKQLRKALLSEVKEATANAPHESSFDMTQPCEAHHTFQIPLTDVKVFDSLKAHIAVALRLLSNSEQLVALEELRQRISIFQTHL